MKYHTKGAFERLSDTSNEMEIWWDSSPLVYKQWFEEMISNSPRKYRDIVKDHLTRLYNESNPNESIFSGVTTNPRLSLHAIKKNQNYWKKEIEKIIRNNNWMDEEEVQWNVYKELVKKGSDMFMPVHNSRDYPCGYISAQVDPRHHENKDLMIEQAVDLASINPNVMIKIPGSRQGIEAVENLTSKGIPTNSTLNFTLPQIIECANSVKRGLEEAKKNGVDLTNWKSVISHMIGRYGNLGGLKNHAHESGIVLSEGDIRLAEVAIFKEAYKRMKKQEHPSKLLACSLIVGPQVNGINENYHLEHLSGGDIVVTCPPSFIEKVYKNGENLVNFSRHHIEEDVSEELMERLEKIPYYENAIKDNGYSADEFSKLPVFVKTVSQFSESVEDMIDFVRKVRKNT